MNALLESLIEYQNHKVVRTISDNERMLAPTWEGYNFVGASAIEAITAALIGGRSGPPHRILDFGCGHGRVARHLRAWRPDAQIFAADVRADGASFCADTFDCVPVVLDPQFGVTDLPEVDLIWVGSVFTHIDYDRMKILWNWLWNSVSIEGSLVATFHGPQIIKMKKENNLKFINDTCWEAILREFQKTGRGYQSYNRDDLGDWGVSIVNFESLAQIGAQAPNSVITNFSERGWANLQDVMAWKKKR